MRSVIMGIVMALAAGTALAQDARAVAEMDGHLKLIETAYACDDLITFGVAVRSAKRLASMSFPGQDKLREIVALERSLEDGEIRPELPGNCARAIEDAKIDAYPFGY